MANDFGKLILDSHALQIWNRTRGPIFWYTAGVPGPFFVNTEWIIGRELAQSLVDAISVTIETAQTPLARADQLDQLILSAWQGNPRFQNVVAALSERVKAEFSGFDFVSGGERRDWLFSLPLAHLLGLPHLYLFKDLTAFCRTEVPKGARVLHVADLINNAASYFERWLPALAKIEARCIGTICVNSRGEGAEKLVHAGIPVAALARIDTAFFRELASKLLISEATLAELECHARSPREWAEAYLLRDDKIFDVKAMDGKAFERLTSFIRHDPWSLRAEHAPFFERLEREIAARRAA